MFACHALNTRADITDIEHSESEPHFPFIISTYRVKMIGHSKNPAR